MNNATNAFQVIIGITILGVFLVAYFGWQYYHARAFAEQASAGSVVQGESNLILKDINIPFGRLVALFIKVGFAAIPAVIIVFLTFQAVSTIFMVILARMN